MNGPVHLWTRPSDQGEPFGAYGQAVDNTAVLPTACPHSRPSRPQDTQAQNALRLYNAMNGLRESRQGDRTTQRTNTKQGQASPKELGGKTRIYSHDKKSVRIRTTVRKLAESLGATLGDLKNIQCYIGKVEYLPNKRLMNFANTVFSGIPQPRGFAKTLLVKRPAFSHEKEIRLIYRDAYKKRDSKLFSYSIEPHDLFDQIMIDPRLTKDEACAVKSKIIASTKFTGSIKRSLLYAPPEDMVFKIG